MIIFWIIHLFLRLVLEIFDISTFRFSLWFFWAPYILIQKSFFLFPSQILVYMTGFCSSLSLFIWRFIFGELYSKNIKNKVGRDIITSLCKYQDHQDYWPITHDKLEDLFTIITHRFQDFSHTDKCASIKLFEDFSNFYGFLNFEHTKKQNKKSKINNK